MRLFTLLASALAAASFTAALNYTTASGSIVALPDEPLAYESTSGGSMTLHGSVGNGEDVLGLLNGLLGDSDENIEGDRNDPANTLMWFHYGLNFDKRYDHETAGNPNVMPGGCQTTKMPRYTRGVAYKDNRQFFCLAYDKLSCNNKNSWIYLPSRPEGYGDLSPWKWDRRIQAYRCYWGWDCGDQCKK
ncbi:hypothetical protein BDV96DRAFT_294080 [Lophiotrema nucula]|uniref:Prokaryotic phospholipase A2-domain-containing protein n=1 Tax=Lophiotrema nucula TaxID=690887 RepID=A0A6A5YNL4_9PLEO|nr:hypothetical protein BDV96DRAFT_294080 [Lophiotrema nucula]